MPCNQISCNGFPEYPCNKGKKRQIKDILGNIVEFTVEDEIVMRQHNSDRKLLVFQKLSFQADSTTYYEYRLCYYMIGMKGKFKGKWIWGQYGLMVPAEDLILLLNKARDLGWGV